MQRFRVAAQAGERERAGSGPCTSCRLDDLVFCSALAEDERPRLAAIVREVRAEPNQAIFYEGDPARHVFNVTEGTVKLYKLMADGRRQITGFLFRGDFLGLALNRSYAYTAEALEPTRLCRFDRAQIEALLDDFPRLERRLLEMAGNELVAAQDQMLLLGRKTARERIVSLLVLLAGRAERRGEPANPVALPMTRNDIADYLGLTTETVSRALTELRKSGLITLHGAGTVSLDRRDDLDAIAAGEAA